jgi:hypothetical protein
VHIEILRHGRIRPVAGSERFTAIGQVVLTGAHIGGQLSLSGADLRGGSDAHGSRIAFSATESTVDQGMYATVLGGKRFTALGQVRLAVHTSAGSSQLSASRLHHGGDLHDPELTTRVKRALGKSRRTAQHHLQTLRQAASASTTMTRASSPP